MKNNLMYLEFMQEYVMLSEENSLGFGYEKAQNFFVIPLSGF